MMRVKCRLHNVLEYTPASCIDDSSANWRSNEHNRREDRKRLIMIKHPLTKNSAKEEPQNCIIIAEGKQQRKNVFHIFIYIFIIFRFYLIFDFVLQIQCFTLTLTKV